MVTRDIEEQRLLQQVALDAKKNQLERNKLGQFATPTELADQVASRMRQLWVSSAPVRFLEPAVGTGSFYSAFLRAFEDREIDCAAGYEIDPMFAAAAVDLWSSHGLEVIEGDFTEVKSARRFNLVLTNPPYVRHHHLNGKKDRLVAAAEEKLGHRVSALSGLYVYFMVLAHSWLEEGALSAWLIPSEFMDVNYGSALRDYLTERVTLRQIHRFCPSDVQFDDALVSSAVVIFENVRPPAGHRAEFSFGGTMDEPKSEEHVEVSVLKKSDKWSQFAFLTDEQRNHSTGFILSDFFTVKRGLATGDNGFFIVPLDQALANGVPKQFLRPMLPSPRLLKQSVVEGDSDGYAKVDPKLAMIDCDLPEDEVQRRFPEFWRYLEQGIAKGVKETYLASGRKPWYSQERREAAPFICTYMGRNLDVPFRFIWNKSRASATNVYLMLYPKPALRVAMESDSTLAQRVFEVLQSIHLDSFLANGRVYGGGLRKMEPRELMRLPISGNLAEWSQPVLAFL